MIRYCLDRTLMNLLIVRMVIWYVTLWIDIISFRVVGRLVKWVFRVNWVNMYLIINGWNKAFNQAHWFNGNVLFGWFLVDLGWWIAVDLWRIGTVSDVRFDFRVSFFVFYVIEFLDLVLINNMDCTLPWIGYQIIRIGLKVESNAVHHFSCIGIVVSFR